MECSVYGNLFLSLKHNLHKCRKLSKHVCNSLLLKIFADVEDYFLNKIITKYFNIVHYLFYKILEESLSGPPRKVWLTTEFLKNLCGTDINFMFFHENQQNVLKYSKFCKIDVCIEKRSDLW